MAEARFEERLRARPVLDYEFIGPHTQKFVAIPPAERDALADAVEALRKIPELLERAHNGAEGAWAGGAVDEAQDLAEVALARLDAA